MLAGVLAVLGLQQLPFLHFWLYRSYKSFTFFPWYKVGKEVFHFGIWQCRRINANDFERERRQNEIQKLRAILFEAWMKVLAPKQSSMHRQLRVWNTLKTIRNRNINRKSLCRYVMHYHCLDSTPQLTITRKNFSNNILISTIEAKLYKVYYDLNVWSQLPIHGGRKMNNMIRYHRLFGLT